MKFAIKTLRDIAYNIGYEEGLVRDAYLKQDLFRQKKCQELVSIYIKKWDKLKKDYIESLGLDATCPVTKQLIKTLYTDREKHYQLGIKDASANLVPGNF